MNKPPKLVSHTPTKLVIEGDLNNYYGQVPEVSKAIDEFSDKNDGKLVRVTFEVIE